jgi:DNA polymerase
MIIGGGPGKTEDKEGRPLVGLAGRKLDEILKLHDINPGEDVFIANVVACHGKHDPTRVEMAACRSRLQALARIVEPRAILLLGLTAGGLAGVKQVEDWRGQPLSARIGVDEWPATVSWHPSQILDATFEDAIRLQHELALDVRVAWEMARE